jgi:6-phosphogluconate dehydrogenase
MMAQLFAEAGPTISIYDVKGENVDEAVGLADGNERTKGKVHGYKDPKKFMDSLGGGEPAGEQARLLVFSITHGWPADSVLDKIGDYLARGDIILDGGNEWYQNSERRNKELRERKGVKYIGMGVSGGYQSARRGPSLSPGGDDDALDKVMPLLRKVAAKDGNGNPCVQKIGPGGSGHYVKMVHNGIEQGMLSVLCEAWGLLRFNLGLELDEIGELFKHWNSKDELVRYCAPALSPRMCSLMAFRFFAAKQFLS